MDYIDPKYRSVLDVLGQERLDALLQGIIQYTHDGLVCIINVVCDIIIVAPSIVFEILHNPTWRMLSVFTKDEAQFCWILWIRKVEFRVHSVKLHKINHHLSKFFHCHFFLIMRELLGGSESLVRRIIVSTACVDGSNGHFLE